MRKLPVSIISFLLSCGAAAAAWSADSKYTPTVQDLMSIQEAMTTYHDGLDLHDNKTMAKAFTEDATLTLVVNDRASSVTGRDKIAVTGIPGAGPPPNPGAAGGGAGAPPAGGNQAGELWHFSGNDKFTFESPTLVRHYGYWLSLNAPPGGGGGNSAVGSPGHYEDVLIKQKDGRWLFKERKIIVGKK